MPQRRSVLTAIFENLPDLLSFDDKIKHFKRILEVLIQDKLVDPSSYQQGHPFCTSSSDLRYVKRWLTVMLYAEELGIKGERFEDFLASHDLSLNDHETWLDDPRSYFIDELFRCLDRLSKLKPPGDMEAMDTILVSFENIAKQYVVLPMGEFGEEVKRAVDQRFSTRLHEKIAEEERRIGIRPPATKWSLN